MIDVVHSVNLDQRLDFPHDQYFPNNTPATIATTTPVQASFGFDLPGDFTQTTSCVNNFFEPNWTLIAAMTFQLSDQDININNSPQSNVSSSQQQNSRQYNDMAATTFSNQHQYSHDSSVQQTSILPSPPFVEPSGNYIAISSATNNTQSLPYGYPSSTLPTSNSNNLDNGNHIGNNYSSINSINSRNAYTTQQQQHQHQQQQQQQQHQHHHHQQQQQHHHQQQSQPSRIEITNQLIPGYNFNPNQCYQPSSIGNNSQHHGNHQKPISRSINNFSRQDATTNLPISIAPNLFMQQFNNQTSNGSTMLVPLYDPSTTIFTAKPTPTPTPVSTTISISQNSTTTSESTSPTKQTYSYSGPPKSYYSRLPLYDRPFKCDQCPQSFNRNHDLKRHKRIHLAVKPYPCQYCEKQFSRKDALKRHVLVKGCNNTSNNNKKSTSSNSNNNNNKNVIESPSNSSISTTTIENYVDNGDPIKTEPTNDDDFEISI